MKLAFAMAGVLLATPAITHTARAEGCGDRTGCLTAVPFASTSDSRSYGLLIAAPDVGCRRVRFRVEDGNARLLGQSPPLAPGEFAVVRMGRGFPQGKNWVTIASVGCNTPPAAIRRVILAKTSPDHSWRAVGF